MSIKGMMDAVYALRFTNLMARPFHRWKAYEYGILDREGNVLRKPETVLEKSHYTKFHSVVRKLKQQIQKVSGSTLTQWIAIRNGWKTFTEQYGEYDFSDIPLLEGLESLQSRNDLIKLKRIVEEMTAGDSGGSVQNIATGVTSGPVTGKGPTTIGKKKKSTNKET